LNSFHYIFQQLWGDPEIIARNALTERRSTLGAFKFWTATFCLRTAPAYRSAAARARKELHHFCTVGHFGPGAILQPTRNATNVGANRPPPLGRPGPSAVYK